MKSLLRELVEGVRFPHFNLSVSVSSTRYSGLRPSHRRDRWPVITATESFMFRYGQLDWLFLSIQWDNDR